MEETHYYPFGLTIAGISSQAPGKLENRLKFNGYEQQHGEFSDGSGLEWYDYKNRFYDNQIGRFFCVDRLASDYPYYTPYQFAGNEVPNAIDLDGLEPARFNVDLGVQFPAGDNLVYGLRPGDQLPSIAAARSAGEAADNSIIVNTAIDFFAPLAHLNTIITGNKPNGESATSLDYVEASVGVVAAMPIKGAGGGRIGGGRLPLGELPSASMLEGATIKAGPKLDGSFSITTEGWSTYPTTGNVERPSGPFRLLEGTEYSTARNAANNANATIHRQDPSLTGKEIHEKHPVKFGGSSTDPANKIPLNRQQHAEYTNWWNTMMRGIQGKK